jgi:hypothetical protein
LPLFWLADNKHLFQLRFTFMFLFNSKLPARLGAAAIAFLLSALTVFAQAESGSAGLEGFVADNNGGRVAGATVTIRNLENGLARTVTTDADGRFNAPVLPVGRYQVEAAANGFATVKHNDVLLSVGETSRLELTLSAGSVSASVDVTSEDAVLDTETAGAGATIQPRAVQDLPIRGRNFTEFVQLSPSVVQESDRGGLVISGQRSINSNVAIDGADFNDPVQGNQRGGNEAVFFFPQTAVREFQVVRTGANAEVGRTNAGFVNVVTKSGTNDVRGEVFYFNRNRRLTSPDAFGRSLDNAQNQFGGSVGGPIKRDRAHYFFGLEQNYLRVPFVVDFQPATIALPSDIAAQEGERRGTNNPTALFARTDFILNQSNTLSLQYTYARLRGENFNFDSPRQDTAESGNYTRTTDSHAPKGSLITIFSPNLINEIRAQVATDNRLEQPNSTAPQANISGFGALGGDPGRPRSFESTRYQVTDNLTWNAGRHRVRFGMDLNISRVEQQRESNIQGRWDYENRTISGVNVTGLENFIARRPRRFRQTIAGFDPEELIFRGTQKEFALFIQDKFDLTRNLSVSAGFRWESQIQPQPVRSFPGLPQTAGVPSDKKMFQPRLGLAWNVGGNGKTVIRISSGLYAARTPANLLQRVFTNNGTSTLLVDISEVTACRNSTDPNRAGCLLRGPNAVITYPNVLTSLPAAFTFLARPRIFGFDGDFKNPRSFQASASVEHRFTGDLTFSATYTRNATWNLQRRIDKNLFPPTVNAAGFPVFPNTRPIANVQILSINESTAHSTYDALNLSLTRRFARKFQFQGHYTLARNIDDDSNERNFSRETTLNPFNLKAEAGYSKQDVRHNLNVSGLFDLGRGFTLSGIIVTRSGFPYTAVIGADQQNDNNDDNDRPVINGRVAERNSFRQPYFFDLDMRLLKAFKFSETKRLELSAEVFNVTRNSNRNFGNDSISEYGVPTATGGPSVAAFGQPLFAPSTARFGGPRQVQLGVRFKF